MKYPHYPYEKPMPLCGGDEEDRRSYREGGVVYPVEVTSLKGLNCAYSLSLCGSYGKRVGCLAFNVTCIHRDGCHAAERRGDRALEYLCGFGSRHYRQWARTCVRRAVDTHIQSRYSFAGAGCNRSHAGRLWSSICTVGFVGTNV